MKELSFLPKDIEVVSWELLEKVLQGSELKCDEFH
jgi:hypothetical protein